MYDGLFEKGLLPNVDLIKPGSAWNVAVYDFMRKSELSDFGTLTLTTCTYTTEIADGAGGSFSITHGASANDGAAGVALTRGEIIKPAVKEEYWISGLIKFANAGALDKRLFIGWTELASNAYQGVVGSTQANYPSGASGLAAVDIVGLAVQQATTSLNASYLFSAQNGASVQYRQLAACPWTVNTIHAFSLRLKVNDLVATTGEITFVVDGQILGQFSVTNLPDEEVAPVIGYEQCSSGGTQAGALWLDMVVVANKFVR